MEENVSPDTDVYFRRIRLFFEFIQKAGAEFAALSRQEDIIRYP